MTWVIALVLGAIYPLGHAPFHFLLLTLGSITGFWLILDRYPSRALWLAWCYGIGKYAVGVSWIYVSIQQYGGASVALATFLVSLFVAFMALFCVPIGLLYRSYTGASLGFKALLFTAAWVTMEWALTWFLTGFPWLFAGFAMTDSPLAGFAPLLGVLGVSALTVASSVCIAMGICAYWKTRSLGSSLAIGLLPWGVGMALGLVTWSVEVSRHEVALVQGNIDQAIKWDADQLRTNVERHWQLSEPHWDSDLIIWPEFAITLYGREAEAIAARLQAKGMASQTNVVAGMPGLELSPDAPGYRLYNLAQGFGQATGRFAKHHLVPFGDYVPLEQYLRGLIEFFDLPMSAASRGPREQTNVQLTFNRPGGTEDVVQAAIGICYEIAYGESLRRQAQEAGVLITISNDTWFGASIGPQQHMQIARMRALESGRWLLRSTNSGVTGIVDAGGVIQQQLPQFQPAVLRGEFAVMSGQTPYVQLGDLPLLAFFGCFWLLFLLRWGSQKSQ